MKKFGLSKSRLNYAKDHSKKILETVEQIEMMYNLSVDGHIDENTAKNFIERHLRQLDKYIQYLRQYMEPEAEENGA